MESHSTLLTSELMQNKNPTNAVTGNGFCGKQDFIKVFVADPNAIRVLPIVNCVP